MKKRFRFAASILVIVFLFTSFSTNVCFAEAEGEVKEDENSTQIEISDTNTNYGVYDEAIKTLFRFDILDEESFEAKANVTRGDFIAKAMKITGIGDTLTTVDTEFKDVTKENPNSGAIKAAADMGVVKGYGDGAFGVNDTLTKEQSVKILVSMLGYDVYANAYGGYPGGYLAVASLQGILKKVEIGDYTECTWGAAAQLIFNAMEADVLQVETYPENKYFSNKGENPMTLWMGIYMHEGIITANDITSLSSADGLKTGMLKIDEQQYSENNTGASNYLGYPVEAYYKLDSNENRTLMSIRVKSTVSEIYSDADDIDKKTAVSAFYWYEEGKGKVSNQAISADAKVFYNGKLDTQPLTATTLMPDMGGVKLIDTSNDGKADLVFINDTKIYVVKTIVYATRMIKDRYNQGTLTLDPEDADLDLKITKYGETISFTDIKENNVLCVNISRDGKLCNIDVCSDKKKGIVGDIGEDTIEINDAEYKIARANRGEFKELKTGDKTNFFMTKNGEVAGFGDVSKSGTGYGYLVVGSIALKGLEKGKKAVLRILNTENEFREYQIDESITLNGESEDASGNRYTPVSVLKAIAVLRLKTPSEDDEIQRVFCNQIIKYTVNSQDMITAVETATNNRTRVASSGESPWTGEAKDEFTFDYSFYTDGGYRIYKGFGLIAGRFVGSNAVAFRIPNKGTWEEFYKGKYALDKIEKQTYVFSISNDWANDYKLYNIEVYDVNENMSCGAVVEVAQGGSSGGGACPLDLFVVENVVNSMDSDGYPVKKVYGIYKGEKSGYVLDEEAIKNANYSDETILDLQSGDVLRVCVNSLGEMTNYIKIFTMDAEKTGYLLNSKQYDDWNNVTGETATSQTSYTHSNVTKDWNQMHNTVHCKYVDVDGSVLKVRLGYKEGEEDKPLAFRLLFSQTYSKYYVYDEKEKTVTLGSIEDIDPDNPRQTMVVRNRYFEAYETVIINREYDPETIYWVGPYSE